MKCFRCKHAKKGGGNPLWIFCAIKGVFLDCRDTCEKFKEVEGIND